MTEAEYRNKIEDVYTRVDQTLSSIDPDLVECEKAQGVLTLLFADQSKCILSAQPSMRQLWVAFAALGVAYHFDYQSESNTWLDDKKKGIELFSWLEKVLMDKIQQEICFHPDRSSHG